MQRSIRLVWVLALCCYAPAMAAQATPAVPGSMSATPVVDQARLDGVRAADSAGGWFGRSVVIGFFLPVWGPVVTMTIAATSTPSIPVAQKAGISNHPPEYQAAFEESFQHSLREKRTVSAFLGGLTGTAGLFGVLALLIASGAVPF